MDEPRRLIAALVVVRRLIRREVFNLEPATVPYISTYISNGSYHAVAYNPRFVRMVKVTGSRIDVIPKNGGER